MTHAYLTARSLSELFFTQAEKYKDDVFMRAKLEGGLPSKEWKITTWGEAADQARNLGAGLVELGIVKGDRVAIFSHNRPRWVISDQAIQAAGGWGVPIYPTSTDHQLSYILNDCKAKAVVVGDNGLLEQAVRVKPDVPSLESIIAMFPVEDPPEPSVIDYDSLLKRGAASKSAGEELESRRKSLGPDDVAAIIYTSGTTGEPKGAVLTQKNFLSENEMLLDAPITNKMVERGVRLCTLCHLPLCHIYGRTSDYHVMMSMAGEMHFAESYQKVQENLFEVRPQMLITIPRLYEKVYDEVKKTSNKLTGVSKKLFDWSLAVGEEVVDHMSRGEKMPPSTAIKFALANTLVFSNIRKKSALDRLVFAGSGGGALSEDICRFFRALNLQIGEGYGLTETTSAVSWNAVDFFEEPPDTWAYRKGLDWLVDTMVIMQSQGKNPYSNPVGMLKLTFAANVIIPLMIMKPGTVGRPCKNTEIKIADDGEILVKGPQVFDRDKGYFNRPDLTDEVFTDDGFFMTGDIGHFDQDGFLIITDRKKELLVTAGGKNVAPHPIELKLTLDPMIEMACVVGDKKKYLSALLVPSFEELERWAKKNGIEYSSAEELVAIPRVKELFKDIVAEVNMGLARYEQIKNFCVLPAAFSEETGELTPTQKMKRRVIYDKYCEEIDSCYPE